MHSFFFFPVSVSSFLYIAISHEMSPLIYIAFFSNDWSHLKMKWSFSVWDGDVYFKVDVFAVLCGCA